MATLYITADKKRFVPAGDPEAAFGIAEQHIDREGLRDAYELFIDPPKLKAAKPAANKMARKPSNKGR